MRVGLGYDVHRLVEARPLIIGGVKIEYEKGLLGHSDADVLIHAVMDGILGALCMGDIGRHFPDTDPAYKDVSSMKLLEYVADWMYERHFSVGNIDATIVAQNPKMAPHIDCMRKNIASALRCEINGINIKATTTEGLGFEGRGEGISAQAVVLLNSNPTFKKL